ncbi:MAG: SatD family protein [Bacteroidota bacterium]
MTNYAVISGDIVNFTMLPESNRKWLMESTKGLLNEWEEVPGDSGVFSGDSYQLLIADIKSALKRSIQLICWFKTQSDQTKNIKIGTRVSVGVGSIAYKISSVLDSDGEAFHISGRNLGIMKHGESLAVNTANEKINRQTELILSFVNPILNKWTVPQAEVIHMYLDDLTQAKIADILGIKQSSVNNRLKAAQWKEVENAVYYIAETIEEEFKQ